MGENLFRSHWDKMSDEQRQNLAERIKKHHGFDPRFDEKTEEKKDE
jgi:predicted Fe-S protein YdhL (DUF1289 family)